jgi:hypothetical protein
MFSAADQNVLASSLAKRGKGTYFFEVMPLAPDLIEH